MKSSFKYSPRTQALSWLLRHNAEKEGFVFLEGGFLPVLEVLKHKRFSPAKSLSIKLSVLEVLKLKRFSQAKSLSLSLYEAFSSNTKSPAMYFLVNSVGPTLRPRFRGGGYTLEDVEAVVAECPKQRFSLKTTPEVSQR